MQVFKGFERVDECRGGIVSIGNFDGVHRGHQLMLATLVSQARSHAVPSIVLTFDPHPIALLRPEQAPPQLTTMEQRLELFEAAGVELAIVYPTGHSFLNLEPAQFFQEVLVRQLAAKGLVEGPNFFYGHNRAGNVETLCAACAHQGIGFEVVPAVYVEGELVSSSSIRKLLMAGNVAKAAEFLGRRYRVEGIVKTGAARGRTIGFSTANLGDIETLLPLDGVYATLVKVDGKNYAGALNLGPNPTFQDEQRKFEVHLLDFQGDLYGRRLTVEFVSRLRETRKFASIDELLVQVRADVDATRRETASLIQS